MIIAAASVLRSSFSEEDVLIRLGGDEFVVIVQTCDERRGKITKTQSEASSPMRITSGLKIIS